jgi:dihydrofolate reductase
VVLMGRRTYEALAGLPEQARDESWRRMSALDTVVFSTTLSRADWPRTRICAADLVGEVRRRKAEGDLPLRTLGSLSVARQLLRAGLVDRLRLMMFPLVAGPSGREPAFADLASADLELVDHRALDGRVLLVEYRPTGHDIPRG